MSALSYSYAIYGLLGGAAFHSISAYLGSVVAWEVIMCLPSLLHLLIPLGLLYICLISHAFLVSCVSLVSYVFLISCAYLISYVPAQSSLFFFACLVFYSLLHTCLPMVCSFSPMSIYMVSYALALYPLFTHKRYSYALIVCLH